jgi:hypothetical protein
MLPDRARENYAPHDCKREEKHVKYNAHDDDNYLNNGAYDVHDRLPYYAND